MRYVLDNCLCQMTQILDIRNCTEHITTSSFPTGTPHSILPTNASVHIVVMHTSTVHYSSSQNTDLYTFLFIHLDGFLHLLLIFPLSLSFCLICYFFGLSITDSVCKQQRLKKKLELLAIPGRFFLFLIG